MRGKIKIIKRAKGFGFIVGKNKKRFYFHRDYCQGPTFGELNEGDQVEFEPALSPRGLTASDVKRTPGGKKVKDADRN